MAITATSIDEESPSAMASPQGTFLILDRYDLEATVRTSARPSKTETGVAVAVVVGTLRPDRSGEVHMIGLLSAISAANLENGRYGENRRAR